MDIDLTGEIGPDEFSHDGAPGGGRNVPGFGAHGAGSRRFLGATGLAARGADRGARSSRPLGQRPRESGHKVDPEDRLDTEKPKPTKPDSSLAPVSLVVTPHAHVRSGKVLTVSASGLPHDRTGWILECSSAHGQPTVKVAGVPSRLV